MSVLGICAFCYMWNLHCVVVYHRSLIDGRGWGLGVYICPGYMCIVLCVKHIWCSGIPLIYGQLEEGGLGICAFCYMWNFFGVAVFHTSMVNLRGYICPEYMCFVLYVKHIWYSGIPYISSQLEGGTSTISICAFCYMWNFCGIVVLHRSMVNWRRGSLVHLHYVIRETFWV